jgi:hypothetical protein
MSVIVIARFKLDTKLWRQLTSEREADLKEVADIAKTKGARHHRFGVGDGEVVVIDEWDNAESFQSFITSQPKIDALLADAKFQGPPDVLILETFDTVDQF